MEKEGVLIVGSANMDLVVFADRFPNPGETIFGNKFQLFPGGKGANQAVASGKLGTVTYFLGKLGRDDFGKRLIDNLQNANVDVNFLVHDDDESTGTALITVNGSGENEIIVISGSNMKLTPEDVKSNDELFKRVKVVIAQLEVPINTITEAAKLAKENGCIFILNPAPANELPSEIYEYIDFITPNETELEILSGMKISDDKSLELAAEIILDKGVKNVIVTLGKRGAFHFSKDEQKFYNSLNVKVKDTTGAGDAFNGSFASALSKGFNIHDAIDFAIKVGAFAVTKAGAQSSMPTLSELNSFS